MLRKNIELFGKTLLLVVSVCVALSAGFATAAVKDEIKARIQPAGEVCVIGDECAAGLNIAMAGSGEPKGPEEVYNTYCFACHATGANNSPLYGNAEAWAPRIAKGMDALYESALNGFNNGLMPVKGLCASCTDDEVKATVDYIVQAAQ